MKKISIMLSFDISILIYILYNKLDLFFSVTFCKTFVYGINNEISYKAFSMLVFKKVIKRNFYDFRHFCDF